ncbi:aromatic ring-hydroxylating dioxygenase subunit alpha [Acuticoccus sp. M5D2P5]|uniref:aromatic ring-hydroxylating oxygenase subunit alpha n=1 Tax=Acuticoccus kalidii TaxID=2910977 RepID=UPI001F23AB17|nr:aromatic ring-hydroxylating dioxygenase subunit alpha [Acuticoccus kalidii]MCF3932344.1 aromatic ring-hydroxylating dioxygenase subunit alpha [Acuticoccus kalidii]
MLHQLHDLSDSASHATIASLIAAREAGHMLPAGLYTRPDAFEADLDIIFHRHWICVGLEADVPEAGDVYAVDIGRSSIVIVRDEDETVRAFHNVCSHRGARLVPAGRAIVGKLVCPYHQWAYELTGELFNAPHMGQEFNRGLHHLKPVAIRSIGGILYACLSDDPPEDIEELDRVVTPRLADYDLVNTRIAYESDIVESGNWKLVIENNRECYHCEANHPELCVSFHASDFGFDPEELSPSERDEAAALADLYRDQTEAWEAAGLASAAVEHTVGVATNFRTQRLIIAGSGESQTPDSLAACALPLGTAKKGTGDTHLWGINSWSHMMADHAVVMTLMPLSADRTLVRTKWLVHKDAVEGVDYDLENLTSVWLATNKQDADLVRIAQEGVQSAGFRPGPYSRFTEKQLDDFATWYVERMSAHGYGR